MLGDELPEIQRGHPALESQRWLTKKANEAEGSTGNLSSSSGQTYTSGH